jgi:Domain of unknown function (DUF4129)
VITPKWIGPGNAAATAAASPIDRDTAREAAQRELSKGIYHADDPGLFQRILNAVVDWLDRALTKVAHAAPGGIWGLLALLVIVATAVALILWRAGPLRRIGGRPDPGFHLTGLLSADEHRRRADGFAVDGRFAEAVRERMRAIVRELEDRGVLEPRPGRTADEVAREAGAAVPAVAGDLRAAARLFDEIWYGGRPATAGSDAAMREADQRVRASHLVVAAGSGTSAGYEVPR